MYMHHIGIAILMTVPTKDRFVSSAHDCETHFSTMSADQTWFLPEQNWLTLVHKFYKSLCWWLTAFTPQTTVVFPSFTKDDPSAVDIEPVKNTYYKKRMRFIRKKAQALQ